MHSEVIFLVEEAPEGGFTAKAMGESIFSEAESMAALRDNVKEAVLTHFDEGAAFSVEKKEWPAEDQTGHKPTHSTMDN